MPCEPLIPSPNITLFQPTGAQKCRQFCPLLYNQSLLGHVALALAAAFAYCSAPSLAAAVSLVLAALAIASALETSKSL